MPNSQGLPTPREVAKWNFQALNDWAGIVRAGNVKFKEQIDKTQKHFSDIGTTWSGAAYNAASERVDEDYTQARKVFYEIDDVPGMLEAAGSSLTGYRQVVIEKIADAERLGLWVDDIWQIPDSETVDRSTVDTHQDAVRSAFHALMHEITAHKQTLVTNAELIRASGDLFGSGIEVDEAASQGGRLGGEDGRAVAEATKTGDPAALDEAINNLPQYQLTEQESRDLAAGKEVSTVPAAVQDYYREFYRAAGKDGILAMNDHLVAQEKAGSTVAAAQRTNIVNSIAMLSNENVVQRGPDGKITAPGGYTNLPPSLRELVSGRAEERMSNTSPTQNRNTFLERSKFADLMGQGNANFPPGKEFGIELGRQGASMANYLDAVDKNDGGVMPLGFQDGDRELIERGAEQYLTAASHNHESSYALLTGMDPDTVTREAPDGKPIPGDLSGGALGDQFKSEDYDQDKFKSTVFNHDWADDGEMAGDLYEWVAEDTHKSGPEGVLARQALVAMPDIFAPEEIDEDTDNPKLKVGDDGKAIFENSVNAFNTNPKLADALSHVMSNNIDAFVSPSSENTELVDDPQIPGNSPENPVIRKDDADRLLFLASQSEGGRLGLELGRQTYEAQMIERAITEGDSDPQNWLSVNAPHLATLDARITNSSMNALTYQVENKLQTEFDAKQETFETRQKVGDIVKSLTLDNLEIPGKTPLSTIGNEVFGVMKDEGYEAAMAKFNPEPEKEYPAYQSSSDAAAVAKNQIVQQLFSTLHANGELPSEFIEDGSPVDVSPYVGSSKYEPILNGFLESRNLLDFTNEYMDQHSFEKFVGLAQESGDLTLYVTGKPKEAAK